MVSCTKVIDIDSDSTYVTSLNECTLPAIWGHRATFKCDQLLVLNLRSNALESQHLSYSNELYEKLTVVPCVLSRGSASRLGFPSICSCPTHVSIVDTAVIAGTGVLLLVRAGIHVCATIPSSTSCSRTMLHHRAKVYRAPHRD